MCSTGYGRAAEKMNNGLLGTLSALKMIFGDSVLKSQEATKKDIQSVIENSKEEDDKKQKSSQ